MLELVDQNSVRDCYYKLPSLRELSLEYNTWSYQPDHFGRAQDIPSPTSKEILPTLPVFSKIHTFLGTNKEMLESGTKAT